MILQKSNWVAMLEDAAMLMHENAAYLGEIDARFGDGDHGITMSKIGDVLLKQTSAWKNEVWNLKTFFSETGTKIMNINGGSAGPLWGTLIEGFASCLSDEKACDEVLFQKMMMGALEELQTITTAKVGDKTMMDTLIPAVYAIAAADTEFKSMTEAGKEAAIAGAEASKQYISKFGRAKSYKEQTIGTPDAGAVSMSYFFMGLASGFMRTDSMLCNTLQSSEEV